MRLSIPGRQIGGIKTACKPACKRAGIVGFTFHDLRHTAINNWRLQGHDYFRIMAATGHKTMTVFKRYNTVSKEELKALAGRKPEALCRRKSDAMTPIKTPGNIVSLQTNQAPVAQGTEQRTSNPSVGGSNPPRRASNNKGLPIMASPLILLSEYIGEYLFGFSIHQSLKFIHANRVVPLKDAHGLVAGRRHDAEIVMAF